MSDIGNQLDRLKSARLPCIFMYDWPEPVAYSEGALQAAIFAAIASGDVMSLLLLREDGLILSLTRVLGLWRVEAGEFVGKGTVKDRYVVKDGQGELPGPAKPKLFQRLSPKRGTIDCSWPQAAAIAVHFMAHRPMPTGFAWRPWTEMK